MYQTWQCIKQPKPEGDGKEAEAGNIIGSPAQLSLACFFLIQKTESKASHKEDNCFNTEPSLALPSPVTLQSAAPNLLMRGEGSQEESLRLHPCSRNTTLLLWNQSHLPEKKAPAGCLPKGKGRKRTRRIKLILEHKIFP